MSPSNERRAVASGGRRGWSLLLDWRAWLGIAISALLLWYAFRDEDFGLVLAEIRAADPFLLTLATAAATFVFWMRAWRWRSILEPVRPGTSFRSRFAAVNIGFMGNNLLPARAGEFARAYALARAESIPIVASFSSLVIERLFDGIFVVGLLFLSIALPGFPASENGGGLYVATARVLGVGVAIGLLVLTALVLRPRPMLDVIEAVLGRTAPEKIRRPIVDALEAFVAGISILRSPRLLLEATAWSAALWLVNGLGFLLALRAFDIDVPFVGALFLQSCIALAVSVPSAPGFFGVYEVASEFVLVGMWDVPSARANGFALGFHIAAFIPVTLMGLYYAWQLGMSLSGVAAAEEAVEEAVEEATQLGAVDADSAATPRHRRHDHDDAPDGPAGGKPPPPRPE